MRRSITEIANAWYASSDEVNSFGRHLLAYGRFKSIDDRFSEADNLLSYFEKPWHWEREHAWWVANDRSDDAETWETGEDADWEIT